VFIGVSPFAALAMGDGGKTPLSAVAKNGVELRVRARVTVRTNLDQLIGGATEETIIARVGQGIITAIGSSPAHMDVLKMPDRISRSVLARGVDANTAFEVVSIDIADIDVGDNIGALAKRPSRSGHANGPSACGGASRGSDRVPAGDEGEGDTKSRPVGARRSRNTRGAGLGIPRRTASRETPIPNEKTAFRKRAARGFYSRPNHQSPATAC